MRNFTAVSCLQATMTNEVNVLEMAVCPERLKNNIITVYFWLCEKKTNAEYIDYVRCLEFQFTSPVDIEILVATRMNKKQIWGLFRKCEVWNYILVSSNMFLMHLEISLKRLFNYKLFQEIGAPLDFMRDVEVSEAMLLENLIFHSNGNRLNL